MHVIYIYKIDGFAARPATDRHTIAPDDEDRPYSPGRLIVLWCVLICLCLTFWAAVGYELTRLWLRF
ncbi:hypothetical protein [Bradyrhizobium jicamae]|uniref:hypothetical protein n=1 Tax=Bradyrhizobium jicamae TaxID=280332 RepID=UPI001BAB1809|nr:hypothetical protein [Bradyrhizobium jicamae]MBR0935282.1 hypothetical protein [Bradyrhizobium jicamae]